MTNYDAVSRALAEAAQRQAEGLPTGKAGDVDLISESVVAYPTGEMTATERREVDTPE